jgi:hypothetical protein
MDPKERRLIHSLKTIRGEDFDVRMDLPMYGGKMDVDELLEEVDALNNYFEYKEMVENKKVKFSKIKLKGSTLTWWNYFQGEIVFCYMEPNQN